MSFRGRYEIHIYLSAQFQLCTPTVSHMTCAQPIENRDAGAGQMGNSFKLQITMTQGGNIQFIKPSC